MDGLVVYGNLTILEDLTTTDRVIVSTGPLSSKGIAPDPNSKFEFFLLLD